MHLEVGDEVEVAVDDGVIVIAPVKRIRGGRRLEDLVSRIPAGYEPEEVDWGAPVGREVWQMASYVPRQGDFVAVTFDPPSGHERKGRRPALVVRPRACAGWQVPR